MAHFSSHGFFCLIKAMARVFNSMLIYIFLSFRDMSIQKKKKNQKNK